ncbi:hypothetical protein OIU84_009279 [Salix udensis]|uniref:Uncharacterized protein n=1 Tax=Salix udensis TaxID=889485 RepID=A0AAD6JR46_9ROSI|nr:hypothetical protein OIU84_009279 [Salix udensis]
MKNCGQQRLPDCERKRSKAKNQTKRTMGTIMKSKINFLFKTKKDPLEISKNLRKTKHKNLSDTSRNSRMKETDKELPRRREKVITEKVMWQLTKIEFIDTVVP